MNPNIYDRTNEEPTQFVEANALLALVNNDEDTARRLFTDMLDRELIDLATAAERLGELAQAEWNARNGKTGYLG